MVGVGARGVSAARGHVGTWARACARGRVDTVTWGHALARGDAWAWGHVDTEIQNSKGDRKPDSWLGA